MTTFDYVFEEIIVPISTAVADMVVELTTAVAELLLTTVFIITFPLWIAPYAIIRRRKSKRRSTDEVQQTKT